MAYSFNHKPIGSTVGSGSYVFRHYGDEGATITITASTSASTTDSYCYVGGTRYANCGKVTVTVEPGTLIIVVARNINNYGTVYLNETAISHYTKAVEATSSTSQMKYTEAYFVANSGNTAIALNKTVAYVTGNATEQSSVTTTITKSGTSTGSFTATIQAAEIGVDRFSGYSAGTYTDRKGAEYRLCAKNGVTINGTQYTSSASYDVTFKLDGNITIAVTFSGNVLSRTVAMVVTGSVTDITVD